MMEQVTLDALHQTILIQSFHKTQFQILINKHFRFSPFEDGVNINLQKLRDLVQQGS